MVKRNWKKWRDIRAKYVFGKSFDNLSPKLKRELLKSEKNLRKKLTFPLFNVLWAENRKKIKLKNVLLPSSTIAYWTKFYSKKDAEKFISEKKKESDLKNKTFIVLKREIDEKIIRYGKKKLKKVI